MRTRELIARSARLRERIALQREKLRIDTGAIRERCAVADCIVGVIGRNAPARWALAIAAIAGGIVLVRHRRLLQLAGYVTAGISLYARLRGTKAVGARSLQ